MSDAKLPNGLHEDVLQWLSCELDGELAEPQRVLLHDHLDGCPRCATVAAQWRAARRAIAADARSVTPMAHVGLVDRILAHVKRAEEGATLPSAPEAFAEADLEAGARVGPILNVVPLLRRSAALAAALLALIAGFYVSRGPTQAVAGSAPTLGTRDPALMRVLDRWQRGREAPPTFFELLLAPTKDATARPASPDPGNR